VFFITLLALPLFDLYFLLVLCFYLAMFSDSNDCFSYAAFLINDTVPLSRFLELQKIVGVNSTQVSEAVQTLKLV
jgi:hypothetical protein